MKGWLIHNGSLQTDKFKQIHTRYLNQAKKQGIHLTLKRNDDGVTQSDTSTTDRPHD